jgi:hypothetical protein
MGATAIENPDVRPSKDSVRLEPETVWREGGFLCPLRWISKRQSSSQRAAKQSGSEKPMCIQPKDTAGLTAHQHPRKPFPEGDHFPSPGLMRRGHPGLGTSTTDENPNALCLRRGAREPAWPSVSTPTTISSIQSTTDPSGTRQASPFRAESTHRPATQRRCFAPFLVFVRMSHPDMAMIVAVRGRIAKCDMNPERLLTDPCRWSAHSVGGLRMSIQRADTEVRAPAEWLVAHANGVFGWMPSGRFLADPSCLTPHRVGCLQTNAQRSGHEDPPPPATRFLGTGHGMFRRDTNWHRTPRSAPSSADRMSVSQPRGAVANPAPTAQSARAGKVQGTGPYSVGTMCLSSPCCRPLAAHTPHATRCWFWAAHPCGRRTRAWSGSAMDPSSQDERAGGEIGFREGRLGDESPAESSGHPLTETSFTKSRQAGSVHART